MAKITRSAFKAAKNTRYATNGIGAITGTVTRAHEEDTADSVVFIDDDISTNSDFTVDGTKLTTRAAIKTLVDSLGSGIEYSTASGTNTYTATVTGITAYTEGDVYAIKFTNGNTGSATLNINAIGAITLKKSVSVNLSSGDLIAGGIYILIYDGTNFIVIGLAGSTAAGAANEIQINNGSNALAGGKVFIPTSGNVTLGDSGLAGANRIVTVAGSATNIDIDITPKGTGSVDLNADTTVDGILEVTGASEIEIGGDLTVTDGTNDYIFIKTDVTRRVEIKKLLRGLFTQDDALTRVLAATSDGDVYYRAASSLPKYDEYNLVGTEPITYFTHFNGSGRTWSDLYDDYFRISNNGSPTGQSVDSRVLFLTDYPTKKGIIRITSGTGTGGIRIWRGANYGFGQFRIEVKQSITLSELSDGTDTYIALVGILLNTSETDGAYFRYTHGTNGGRWQAITVASSTPTTTDTGVAATASASDFQLLEIDINSAGTSVVFKINGSTVATHTDNIPTNTAMTPMISIDKTAGSTSRRIIADYYAERIS
jgi:hypothetical protein